MNRTAKIILISTSSLALAVGAFFGVRYLIRRNKKKGQIDTSKTISPSPTNQGSTSGEIKTETKTPTNQGSTNIVTSSGVPVVLTSLTSTEPVQPSSQSYNANSVSFKRLDEKLKKLYRIFAILDRKDGKTIFVEAEDFKPEKPNQEIGLATAQVAWREGYNNVLDLVKGFNTDEKDNPTRSYGNLLIDIFKTQRLDYLFPPKTADGKETTFSPNAQWYKDAEKNAKLKGLKTDFWKSN